MPWRVRGFVHGPMRRWAGRPQLKRDPLGGCQEPRSRSHHMADYFALPLRARVRTGVSYALVMGAIFSVVATINALGHGGRVVLRAGGSVGLLPVLACYLLGGPATGALFGLLFPLMRRRLAAYAVGLLAALPVNLAALASLDLLWPWTRASTFVLVPMTFLLGGFGSIIVREITLAKV